MHAKKYLNAIVSGPDGVRTINPDTISSGITPVPPEPYIDTSQSFIDGLSCPELKNYISTLQYNVNSSYYANDVDRQNAINALNYAWQRYNSKCVISNSDGSGGISPNPLPKPSILPASLPPITSYPGVITPGFADGGAGGGGGGGDAAASVGNKNLFWIVAIGLTVAGYYTFKEKIIG